MQDFFGHQDHARRTTKWLVLLFLLAVVSLVCLANLLIFFCIVMFNSSSLSAAHPLDFFSWKTFTLIGLGVNLVIGLAIAYKWLQLSDGGKSVAESLGGNRVSPNTTKPEERRLLNIVEEMALASGMPVPPVYLLASERGINAFAAGYSPADAVVGITQGCLDLLNREQLQGVIAHEFSHILNGDTRMNLRLIAFLNGILFLGHAGRFVLRTGSSSGRSYRRGGDWRLFLVGLGMAILGWLGMFFGGLIKAAINRQREYLADASAVQYTRNPSGIADALKIIGGYSSGSRVMSAGVDEVSHMFIGNALNALALFATHPPLEDRIRRLERDWDGKMIKQAAATTGLQSKMQPNDASKGRAVAAGVVLGTILNQETSSISKYHHTDDTIPESLVEKLRDPFTASSMLYALLLVEDPELQKKQLDIIRSNAAQGSAEMSIKIASETRKLNPALHVVLIEKAMPALKCMSKNQYLSLRKVLKKLIQADKKIELFEWCMFQMVRHYLGAEFGDRRPTRQRHKSVNDLADHYTRVLSTIIHHCHLQPERSERAFTRGATSAGLYHASLLPISECTVDDFIKDIHELADSYPSLKARLLKGIANVVEFDGTISAIEKELITCIAGIMGSPIPRLKV